VIVFRLTREEVSSWLVVQLGKRFEKLSWLKHVSYLLTEFSFEKKHLRDFVSADCSNTSSDNN